MTYRAVYYLRLAYAATETVVFVGVLFGLLPIVPDTPDISSYTGVMMHLVVPPLVVVCFLFNDAPVGRLKWYEPLYGSVFITAYAAVMAILLPSGTLVPDKAPYSILDFEHSSPALILLCLAGVYVAAYLAAAALAKLNRKLTWIWFRGTGREVQ